MDATHKILAKRRMNRAVPRETAEALEPRRSQHDMEVRLTPFAPARMTSVTLAVVPDFKNLRRQFGFNPRPHFINDWHFFASTSSQAGAKP